MELFNNHIRVEVFSEEVANGHNKTLANLVIDLHSGVITVTPDIIVEKASNKIKKKDIFGFNGNISCNERNTLIIRDFKYFTLAAYSNTEPILAHLKVYNATQIFRLNNLSIARLDSENSNALVVGSDISEMYVGIESWHNKRLANITNVENLKTNTDIRNSSIKKLKTYIQQDKINLQDSNIGEMVTSSDIDVIHSWQGSIVRRLTVDKCISQLKIEDSLFETMKGKKGCVITYLSILNSSIIKAYELFETNIKSRNSDSLMIISESYKNSRNKEKQYKYSYLFQKEQTKNIATWFRKLTRKVLEFTCGYGYKLERGLYFIFYVWAFFSILYTVLSSFDGYGLEVSGNEVKGIRALFYSMYFSIITLTTVGSSDVIPLDLATSILSGIESILSVSTMAIIIYALTKHD